MMYNIWSVNIYWLWWSTHFSYDLPIISTKIRFYFSCYLSLLPSSVYSISISMWLITMHSVLQLLLRKHVDGLMQLSEWSWTTMITVFWFSEAHCFFAIDICIYCCMYAVRCLHQNIWIFFCQIFFFLFWIWQLKQTM